MDPFTGVALGLGALSSLSQLLGGARAQRSALLARERAVQDFIGQSLRSYGELDRAGHASVMSLAGRLGDALRLYGRSLGGALAGAGVWNASSVAGSISSKAESDASLLAQALREYEVSRSDRLASLARDVAQMRSSGAISDYQSGVLREQQGLSGLSSLASVVGQMGLGGGRASVGGASQTGDAAPWKSNNASAGLLQLRLPSYDFGHFRL